MQQDSLEELLESILGPLSWQTCQKSCSFQKYGIANISSLLPAFCLVACSLQCIQSFSLGGLVQLFAKGDYRCPFTSPKQAEAALETYQLQGRTYFRHLCYADHLSVWTVGQKTDQEGKGPRESVDHQDHGKCPRAGEQEGSWGVAPAKACRLRDEVVLQEILVFRSTSLEITRSWRATFDSAGMCSSGTRLYLPTYELGERITLLGCCFVWDVFPSPGVHLQGCPHSEVSFAGLHFILEPCICQHWGGGWWCYRVPWVCKLGKSRGGG